MVGSSTTLQVEAHFKLISSYDCSFIVQASHYDRTVITIVNYDHKTFIVPASGLIFGVRPEAVRIEHLSVPRWAPALTCKYYSGWKPTNLTSVFTLQTSIYHRLMVQC